MTNQLFGALSKGGLTTEKRPLSILFSDQLLNQKVYLQRIDAEQAINSGINAELLCFATDSTIPLKSFIGCQVAVDQRCDDGRIFRLSGIITGAIQGDSDGAITSYLLTLEDPLSLMDKRTNNRVFLNKSVLDVIKILFRSGAGAGIGIVDGWQNTSDYNQEAPVYKIPSDKVPVIPSNLYDFSGL